MARSGGGRDLPRSRRPPTGWTASWLAGGDEVTTLGKLLDPIADKLLTVSAFIALVELRLAPAWMIVVIVGREFAVSGMRNIAAAREAS